MTYQLGQEADPSKQFKLLWLTLDPSKWTSWVVAGFVLAAGLGLFLASLRPVRAAWHSVNAGLRARGVA
jgi:hypothetical protein